MLNIIETIKKQVLVKIPNQEGNKIRLHKRNLPANKEWYNSVYAFDKNSTRFLPAVHDYVFKLLRRYFNMANTQLETNLKTRKAKRLRRSSGRKVWISTPEIKHVSGKINVTIYVYNRVYNYYKKRLNSLNFSWAPLTENNQSLNVIPNKSLDIKGINGINTNKSAELIRNKQLSIYPNKILTTKSAKQWYIKVIQWLKLDRVASMEQNIKAIYRLISKNDKQELIKGLNLLKLGHQNYLINKYKKELLYLKLKQKMLFNDFKFSELYLLPMIEFLQTIYKKKVEFNIVTLKYHYLSSSILSQILVAKIKNPKYRGQSLKPVDRSLIKVKTPNLSGNKVQRIHKEFIGVQNIILNKVDNKLIPNKDSLNELLLKNSDKPDNVEQLALSNIENKNIAGVFVKISGRLTKRYKAQRAVSKLRYKGTLKNVHSAHKGLPSSLSRGYANINVEKTMIHSKTRVGAFGLTGWVASY